MVILSMLGLATQAHAIEPSECGELHNDVLEYAAAQGWPNFATHAAAADWAIQWATDQGYTLDEDIARAWTVPMDTAAYDAAALADPVYYAHLDAIVAVLTDRPVGFTEGDLLADLVALDATAQTTLIGGQLEMALCVSNIAQGSIEFWFDRTEDWVIIADGGEEGSGMGTYKPSDHVNGSDVLVADALGAAVGGVMGGIGGALFGGAGAGPGALYGAISSGAGASAVEGGWQKHDSEAEKATKVEPEDEPPEDDDTNTNNNGDGGGPDVDGGEEGNNGQDP